MRNLRSMHRRVGAMLAALTLSGCPPVGGPVLTPLAPARLVMVTRGASNEIGIRMSGDGQVWTEPSPVMIDASPAQTVATPNLFNDGTLYKLVWLAPDGAVRFATSRDTTGWVAQASPLTTLPPTSVPSFAQGAGKFLAALTSGGTVTVLDLASVSGNRVTVMQGATSIASMTNAGTGFVLAAIGTDRGVHVFRSPDGVAWQETATIAEATLVPGRVELAEIGFAEGRFVLATRMSLGGEDIPVVRCRVFESSDAAAWTQDQQQACSNSATAMMTTVFNGHTLVFENFDNQFLRVSVDVAPFSDTHVDAVNGRGTITVGGGPPVAWLHFNQVDVARGSGQNLVLITLGFHARVGGAAGNARVTRTGRILDFPPRASAGGSAVIPADDSPLAWFVQPSLNPTQTNGQVDIMGAVVIGLDRGGCPAGPINDRVEQARSAFKASLDANLVTTPLSVLRDPVQAKAAFERIKADVMQRLGGNPDSGVIAWLNGAVDSVGRFVVCNVVSGGGGVDEQFSPAAIVLIGNPAVADDPMSETFALNPNIPAAPLPPLLLQNADRSKQWLVRGTRHFLGVF
jgi:hypothetical protein